MSEDGGGKGWSGNKGEDAMTDPMGHTVGDSFAPSYGGSVAAPDFSYTQPDFSYTQPDTGNLDYLSAPDGGVGGSPAQAGGFVDNGVGGAGSGYGDGGDLPTNASPTSGVVGPDTGFIPTVGSLPEPNIGQPGHAFSADAFTYGGPAGASSVPNAAALNFPIINSNPTATLDNPGGTGGPPTGMSAAGGFNESGGAGGGSGGSRDLSASNKDDNFLSKFGIKNPIGTALAGAGLAASMIQGNKLTNEQRNLSALAGPAMQTGRELTEEGRAVGRVGIDDLRTRAEAVPGVVAEGNKIVANNAANLTELAKATTPNSQALQDRGTSLTGYVGTGTLPPEMQAQVNQASSDAKTARVSFYASKGMPTDPRKNTSLRSDLERIDRDAIIMGNTMASDLAKTGTGVYTAGVGGTQAAGGLFNQAGGQGSNINSANLNAEQLAGNMQKSAADIGQGFVTSGIASSGLASTTYANLAKIDQEQTVQTQKAIAAMAAALSGGTPGGGTTIKLS